MRRNFYLPAALAAAFSISIARSASASIVSYSAWSPNTSDMTIQTPALQSDGMTGNIPTYSTAIDGAQASSGAVDGTIKTNSASDPILHIEDSVNNDTPYAWSQYEVDVLMNNTFSLTVPAVVSPASGWIVNSGGTVPDGSMFEDVLTFTGAPPIAIGDTLDFTYTLSFSGLTSFSFDQVFTPTPVPEPTTLSVLILGGAGMLVRRRRAVRRA
jgi:hypothetical protein